MGYLLDNVLQQREEVRRMGKIPIALRCDKDSFDLLINEAAPFMSAIPFGSYRKLRIYDLPIEVCAEPGFEVVSKT